MQQVDTQIHNSTKISVEIEVHNSTKKNVEISYYNAYCSLLFEIVLPMCRFTYGWNYTYNTLPFNSKTSLY